MINKDTVLPMDKICRSCMTEGPEMRSLYEMTTESVQFADMMMACTTVQVNNLYFTFIFGAVKDNLCCQCASGDGLPSQICSKCEEQLNTAYLFKQQCERTDAALREYTTQPQTIKEENESLDIVVKPDIEMLDMFDDDNRYSDSESQHSNYSTTVKKKKKTKGSGKSKNRQCKYCNKVLSTKEGLKLHERKHTGEKLKHCLICNTTFAKTNLPTNKKIL